MAIFGPDGLFRSRWNTTNSRVSFRGCPMPKASTSLARKPRDVSLGEELSAKAERPARKTILCIEDDLDTADLISEELESRGYNVIIANNGREGWSALLKSRPDIILSDINMPFMSGFEILESLKEITPRFARVPFIFLTAMNDRNDELKGRLLGADDYVAKPIDFNLLHAIINARIKNVARMQSWPTRHHLNDREIEALMWAARGKTSEEISLIMSIAERTVNFHLNNARDKLGVATRIQAAVKATVAGFIEP
jgi:DNA-binding response OmpR family regulator